MPLVSKPEHRAHKANPLDRPDYVESDIQALRAVACGDATGPQQVQAMKYIVDWVCATYDMPFRNEARTTDLALGKMLVGQHLVWLLQQAPAKSRKEERDV